MLLYTLERFSFVAPSQGNIALGDVNGDGQIDLGDVLLIMTYVANPLDPTLPDGIGLATDLERAVLIALYEATRGDEWSYNTNWLNSTYPLARWYGVRTDHEGRVTRLFLSDNDLTGPVPKALGNLTNLQSLWLDGNGLTGRIPEALGNLTNLQYLWLSGNELTGPIPEALGNLTNLQYLWLSGNGLTGPIPEALGNLTNLQILGLDSNGLTGPIPEALGNLTNLRYLYLGGNGLTCIPSALQRVDLDIGLGFCPTPATPAIVALYGTLVTSFQNVFFAVLIPGTTSVAGEGGGSVEIAGSEWTFQDYSPDGALIINGTLNVDITQMPIPLTGTVTLSGSQEAEIMLDMAIAVEGTELSATGTITIDGAEFDVAAVSAAAAAAAETAKGSG